MIVVFMLKKSADGVNKKVICKHEIRSPFQHKQNIFQKFYQVTFQWAVEHHTLYRSPI